MVAQLVCLLRLRARCAAENEAVFLKNRTKDKRFAVGANRCHVLDCTFETIKDFSYAIASYRQRLVVLIAATVTCFHNSALHCLGDGDREVSSDSFQYVSPAKLWTKMGLSSVEKGALVVGSNSSPEQSQVSFSAMWEVPASF